MEPPAQGRSVSPLIHPRMIPRHKQSFSASCEREVCQLSPVKSNPLGSAFGCRDFIMSPEYLPISGSNSFEAPFSSPRSCERDGWGDTPETAPARSLIRVMCKVRCPGVGFAFGRGATIHRARFSFSSWQRSPSLSPLFTANLTCLCCFSFLIVVHMELAQALCS